MDGSSLPCALPSSSRPAWEHSHGRAGDPREQVAAYWRQRFRNGMPPFPLHSVSQSKSQNRIRGIKKWTLLSERRGTLHHEVTGWGTNEIRFSAVIISRPSQRGGEGVIPTTLQ